MSTDLESKLFKFCIFIHQASNTDNSITFFIFGLQIYFFYVIILVKNLVANYRICFKIHFLNKGVFSKEAPKYP